MKKIWLFTSLLFTALLLWQCGGERPESLSADMTAQLAGFPQDNSVFAYLNLDKIRQSSFYDLVGDSLQDRLHRHRDLNELLEATGFDPHKDINQLYFSLDPNAADAENSMLIVAVGQFDLEKITAFISEKDSEHSLKREVYQNQTLYYPDDEDKAFCFGDENHLVGGQASLVKSWLDSQKSGEGRSLNETLRNRLQNLRYKNTAWMMMDTELMMEDLLAQMPRHDNGPPLDALRAVENIQVSFDVAEELKMEGAGDFTDAQKAELFHDAVKGMLATIKLSVSSDREAVDVINKVEVDTEGNRVRVNFEMNKEDVKKLMSGKHRLAFNTRLCMSAFDPLSLIGNYYPPETLAREILLVHSRRVARKALELADRVADQNPDREFIHQAALLHDIGIFMTDAPEIGCFGEHPYIMHGYLGRELLEKEGYPKHALVCERHTGVGITRAEVIRQNLPLPQRDFVPLSLEEKIICLADKFFSKNPPKLRREKSLAKIRRSIARHGEDKARILEEWIVFFGLE